jgi:hypothetical protein
MGSKKDTRTKDAYTSEANLVKKEAIDVRTIDGEKV